MNFMIKELQNAPTAVTIINAVTEDKNSPVAVFGLSDIGCTVFSAFAFKKTGKKVLVLAEKEADCMAMAADAENMGLKTVVLPARDYNISGAIGFSREYEHRRIKALWKMCSEDFDIVFADAQSVTMRACSAEYLKKSVFEIRPGDELNIKDFCSKLIDMGYEINDQVDGIGQIAVRGGIVDLFSPEFENPIRIELWGDEIDTICEFDIETQRRGESLEKALILPAAEFFGDSKDFLQRLEKIYKQHEKKGGEILKTLGADIEAAKNGSLLNPDRYIPLMASAGDITDYIKDFVAVIYQYRNISSRLKNLGEMRINELREPVEKSMILSECSDMWRGEEVLQHIIKENITIYADNFGSGKYPVAPKNSYDLTISKMPCWPGGMDVLTDDLRSIIKSGSRAAILTGSEKSAKIIIEQLKNNSIMPGYAMPDDDIKEPGVYVIPASLSAGVEFDKTGLTVISYKPVRGKKHKTHKRNKAEVFSSLDELKVGDYVVHISHGIGQFDGIHRIETGKTVKDYIKIKYRGSGVLYVPVTQLDLVSRYIGGASESGPVLNKLGSSEWQKTRKRVKTVVKNMAKELTALYAERLRIKGHAFAGNMELESDFERKFPFDETEDQLKAIDEIKRDMEREVPMDRLLCGDVGFGKTEVALRAAFKCVCDGKQCAILVPTTILAWQHYLTATERFTGIPVKIEMLSRFRTASEIKKTITSIKRGETDIVIGTHRLLSDDIKFKDLGLVIVDEEQRFGVAQKEKLKSLFKTVDVLTLTATPIPRTLNMAMSGIRDMSSIEEAPQDRQPVQTYVMEQNNGVLAEAIRRELRRGGQVYYLHNRVESINRCAARLKELIPEAEIDVAHGKMSEEELSAAWKRLLDGETDILVCTTIIETGIDVPNANTLIIEDADRMGLAQLHQIRGRVGRSSRRAYAYFCFRRGKALSEVATKRLEAIREYTKFGAGFKIAMRDLEIRGAGSILGGQQHGQMEAVGYNMYIAMLNDAISEQQGKPVVEKRECLIDIDISANIPEKYIPSLSQRLGMYRRIADIKTTEDKQDVIDELCDRFSDPPKEVLGLIDIALLKGSAQALGIYEIKGVKDEIEFYFSDASNENIARIIKRLGEGAILVPTEPMHILYKIKETNRAAALKRIAENLGESSDNK